MAGLYYQVDLGSAQPFDELDMAVPGSPGDYARGYLVEVSDNASSWATVASCGGTGTSEIVSFPAQTARYVRVLLTVAASSWWSIDEFNLYGTGCSSALSGYVLDRSGWAASTNAHPGSADAPANALDGNLSSRFSTDTDQVAGLYYQVDLRSAQVFDELEMVVPGSPSDYARAFVVEVSDNASSWATVAACTGSSPAESVRFPAQTARYVKVVLTAGAAAWWSIDELNLYSASPTTTTTTTSMSSSANPASVGEAVTYTARVSPVPDGGTVSFFAFGAPISGCTGVGVSPSTGEATCSATYFSSRDISIQAAFPGYGRFGPSTSGVYSQVVNSPAPGYWLATRGGAVYGVGAAPSLGGVTTSATTGPVVGIAGTPTARGYWVVTADGTVSNFGDARFYGDLPDLGKHVSDVVAIAPTSDGAGYYLVGADGGFFTFGDATFHGSLPGIHVHARDVVGLVGSPGARATYW